MRMNLEGRVEKISLPPNPPRNCLQPLFEAVVNAIDAVSALARERGRITIQVVRDKTQGVMRTEEGEKLYLEPVHSFMVVDNGVGFNEANMDSFETADTLYKKHIGGKGIGRLMWLKAFDRVEVDSIFGEGQDKKRRTFRFSIADDGTGDKKIQPATGEPRTTTIRLLKMKRPYRENCPRGTKVIAGHIVQHCVEYLIQHGAPSMVLSDPDGEGDVDLNAHFDAMKVKVESTEFNVMGKPFRQRHVLLRRRTGLRHELHFCARQTSVTSEKLENHLPDLAAPITEPDTGEPVVYQGYLSGVFLDETVTPERTGFHMVGNDDLLYDGAIPWHEIVAAGVGKAAEYLEPLTQQARREKEERIREYVFTEAPEYRSLLKHRPQTLARIPPAASGNDLDIELHKADLQYAIELKEQAHRLLEEDPPPEPDLDDYKARLSEFIEEWNDRNKDQLARYVAYRKAILSYLQHRLKLQKDGKYALEEDIHRVIMPLRITSDDVPQDRLNLWIIDERLAFHYYLASDKPLRSVEPVEVHSGKEPDLIAFTHIFDRPFAFAESDMGFASVMIVEFKRPMRPMPPGSSDEDDSKADPVQQVIEYVVRIREGKVTTKDGRPLSVHPNTPFYAYIICDKTPSLMRLATQRDLTPTPDGDGFFYFHKTLGIYAEIITYDKLIRDARQRNAVFFQKLGLPPQLAGPSVSTSGSPAQHDDAEEEER